MPKPRTAYPRTDAPCSTIYGAAFEYSNTSDSESFDEPDEESFDEEGIAIAHHDICEWCSPFQSNCCSGLRMCHMMAGYYNAQSCGRATYLCKDMHIPAAMSLQNRIIALATPLSN